jgi:hypothetical protein
LRTWLENDQVLPAFFVLAAVNLRIFLNLPSAPALHGLAIMNGIHVANMTCFDDNETAAASANTAVIEQ